MKEFSKTRRYVGYVVLGILLIAIAAVFVSKVIFVEDINRGIYKDSMFTDEQRQKLRNEAIAKGLPVSQENAYQKRLNAEGK